jgi:hypothetical protein
MIERPLLGFLQVMENSAGGAKGAGEFGTAEGVRGRSGEKFRQHPCSPVGVKKP